MNSQSILTSVKKVIGIDESYEVFDPDIIMHINSVLSVLDQLGFNRDEEFIVIDKTQTWDNYFSTISAASDMRTSITASNKEVVKSYVSIRVKLIFDPPTSSFVLDSYKKQADELEWRICLMADPVKH